MRRLTASGLARAERCIGSVLLPAVEESGKWANTGNVVDQFVQVAKLRGKAAALAESPEAMRPYLAALTLDAIPDGAEYQVAFALNAHTGDVRRIRGRTDGYPADLGLEWIFGTADIVGQREGRVVVYDLKWGLSTIGVDPGTDLQLGFYAVCAATITGAAGADVAFLRAGWDGVLRPDVVEIDAFDLDLLHERIVEIHRRASSGAAPRLHVGDWCNYCPARRGCDAMVAPTAMMLRGDIAGLAAALPVVSLDEMREKVAALTPEQRGRAYEIAGEIEERAKLIRQAVRDDARAAPIPLSSTMELREVMWGARKISPEGKAREAALEEALRASGDVVTTKVPQVRAMRKA